MSYPDFIFLFFFYIKLYVCFEKLSTRVLEIFYFGFYFSFPYTIADLSKLVYMTVSFPQ